MNAHPFDPAQATARLGHDSRLDDLRREEALDRLADMCPVGERAPALAPPHRPGASPAPRRDLEGLRAHLELFADAAALEGE